MKDDERAKDYTCPACQSPPGRKCTTPTDTGRKPVAWYHYSRTDLVEA